MKWTTEIPSREGWYLYRSAGMERAFYVTQGKGSTFYAGASKGSKGFKIKRAEDTPARYAAQWAGPMPEPEEEGQP